MMGEQHVVLGGNDRGALTEPMLGLARIAHYSIEKIRARQVQLAPQHIRGGVLANDHAARHGVSTTCNTTCNSLYPNTIQQVITT